ncbi:MAG TPA: hemerythrin domain-containing protein [Spirochaetia bacterium]|nr:hemerythrin domain-containing protein [Spirochaetia bacterium]
MKKMMPVGPMMIEHRLIERMIGEIGKEADRLEAGGTPDPDFVDQAVDFIRSYADECHHGKEEDILFRELGKKNLSPEDDKLMRELVADHAKGRALTRKIVEANQRYRSGDRNSISVIVDCMKELREFYPVHIAKEDRHFFQPAMRYFTEEERDEMLEEGFAYDQRLIHRRYENIVKIAETRHQK